MGTSPFVTTTLLIGVVCAPWDCMPHVDTNGHFALQSVRMPLVDTSGSVLGTSVGLEAHIGLVGIGNVGIYLSPPYRSSTAHSTLFEPPYRPPHIDWPSS